MKRAILIFALSRSPWIGGIYYKKNFINLLLHNEKITKRFGIVLLVNNKYKSIFDCYKDQISIVTCDDSSNVLIAGISALKCCLQYRVKYVFPIKPYCFLRIVGITPVSWIADFQHCHYPEFFEPEEIEKRNTDFGMMAKASNPLIVSSNDAKADLEQYFVKGRKNVFVVHFTSAIQDELKEMEKLNIDDLLSKYGLKKAGYLAVCNQFWKHKNHIVVLKALKEIMKSDPNFSTKIVFTGELSDRRNPEYISAIKQMMNDEEIRDNIVLLGFVERTEQLAIMKNALAIIQPSLFEGWGTVVEDAKVLNQRMLLSDLPVHEEQKNENCIMFERENPASLAKEIIRLCDTTVPKVKEYRDLSGEYSKVLTDIFV